MTTLASFEYHPTEMPSPFIRLRVFVQPSPYGKKGLKSAAARFALATPETDFKIDEDQPYGEIWMGDHPNGMAHTLDGVPLSKLIESSPEEYLTPSVYHRFGHEKHLPFLFKVLSFDKALPLQAHPDRALATRLMKKEKRETGKNEVFVDPNHKPEVAVTISETFEGFVGFRPTAEIKSFLKVVPELRKVLSDHETVEKFLAAEDDGEEASKLLKIMFSELLGTTHTEIAACSQQLLTHVERGEEESLGGLGARQGLARVIKKVLNDYPEDVGLFAAVFFMNYVRLHKGEGIAVPADCIHAYLEGDVIECMAWSDNMIACGFGAPPERNDPRVFVDMLKYEPLPSENLELKHETWTKSGNGKTQIVFAPMDEFDLLNTKLRKGEEEVVAGGIHGPAVFIVTEGDAVLSLADGQREQLLKQGQVVFVKPNTGYKLKGVTDKAEIWGAFVEAFGECFEDRA